MSKRALYLFFVLVLIFSMGEIISCKNNDTEEPKQKKETPDEQQKKLQDRKIIESVLNKNQKLLSNCGSRIDEKITGKGNVEIVVQFKIEKNGKVSTASIGPEEFSDTLLEECIVEKVLGLKFPPNDKIIKIDFPLSYYKEVDYTKSNFHLKIQFGKDKDGFHFEMKSD